MEVKPPGSGGKGRAVYGIALLKAELVTEPPDADPHVRWCERRAAAPPSYSILISLLVEYTYPGWEKIFKRNMKNDPLERITK